MMRRRVLFPLSLVLAALCGAVAWPRPAPAADPSGAGTKVVPRTQVTVDEGSATRRVGEQPQVSQPGGVAATGQQAAADAAKVRISRKDCRRLVRHRARADVTYMPGVDVRGRKVAPADLDGGIQLALPDVYEFNITKDLSSYLKGPEEQLAAAKAAALAANKSQAATDAAVSSAALSLDGAQSEYDDAVAAADAAQAAAEAAPNDAALAEAAAEAAATADAAETGLASAETSYDATAAAASANDVDAALSAAEATLSAAEGIGYAQDSTADAASTAATTAASESAAADAAALEAQDVVSKSEGMELTVGTVRFDAASGAMSFNGQPINDAARDDLAAICRDMMASEAGR